MQKTEKDIIKGQQSNGIGQVIQTGEILNTALYLMGVGTPQNILEAIERGVDMFDCVMPTRNGRNAMLFTLRV